MNFVFRTDELLTRKIELCYYSPNHIICFGESVTKIIQPTTITDEMGIALERAYEEGGYASLSAMYREAFRLFLEGRHGIKVEEVHPQRGGVWKKKKD